jgi:hypothetical protein
VVWPVINEVFPARIRGAEWPWPPPSTGWPSAWRPDLLSLVNAIPNEGTFPLLAGFRIVIFVYVRSHVPGTKGKTLAGPEMWNDPGQLRRAVSALE